MPNNKAAENGLLTTAQRSLQASRSAIAKLINATPIDDFYTLERIGLIVSELRTAESILNALEPPYNAIGRKRRCIGAFAMGEETPQ